MHAGADSLQGWQLLSELQLQNEQPELAAESAGRGLKCLAQRGARGYVLPPEVAAGIVLARGHSLLVLDRLHEAQAMFEALTGISTLPKSQPCLYLASPALHLLREGISLTRPCAKLCAGGALPASI